LSSLTFPNAQDSCTPEFGAHALSVTNPLAHSEPLGSLTSCSIDFSSAIIFIAFCSGPREEQKVRPTALATTSISSSTMSSSPTLATCCTMARMREQARQEALARASDSSLGALRRLKQRQAYARRKEVAQQPPPSSEPELLQDENQQPPLQAAGAVCDYQVPVMGSGPPIGSQEPREVRSSYSCWKFTCITKLPLLSTFSEFLVVFPGFSW
jgi:hypothetical protein